MKIIKADSIEKIISFLSEIGIDAQMINLDNYGFSRTLIFKIDNRDYFIQWFTNQSYLKLNNEFSAPNMPFKYIQWDAYSPNEIHKYHLIFSDVTEVASFTNSDKVPFGSFRIPFNK